MNRSKLKSDPALLIDFFEDSLNRLGAVTERSWHDQLYLLADGPAARIWTDEGNIHETAIRFPHPDSEGEREAKTEVCPGCPLIFKLVEVFRRECSSHLRLILGDPENEAPPTGEVGKKLWLRQFKDETHGPSLRIGPFRPAWHFSLVICARTEISAIDQNWRLNRLAFALSNGVQDKHLEENLAFLPTLSASGLAESPSWPSINPNSCQEWMRPAILRELNAPLAKIKTRQEGYLERETKRIRTYFRNYRSELKTRLRRQRKAESIKRFEDRIDAARAEEERRCQDQLQRYEIRLITHLDALLITAERAWRSDLSWRDGRRTHQESATFLARARRWFRDGEARPG